GEVFSIFVLMARVKHQKLIIRVNEQEIPAKIYREFRDNIRYTIGKRGPVMRMPLSLSKQQENTYIQEFKDWVQKQFSKNDILREHFLGKEYKSGDVLKVGDREYVLHFEYTDLQNHTARIKANHIILRLTRLDTEHGTQKAIKHLLSRTVANDFKPYIYKRVAELNRLYFNKEIKKIQLKYNHTRWGSCSSKQIINLSTRLLFAPLDVIDYVIIHELAHMVEMNHSPRFWAIIEGIMPDYREKEKWLKANGPSCDF
ncbi:MAG: M48 family peptidase, partial [Bacteroidetes bacterium]